MPAIAKPSEIEKSNVCSIVFGRKINSQYDTLHHENRIAVLTYIIGRSRRGCPLLKKWASTCRFSSAWNAVLGAYTIGALPLDSPTTVPSPSSLFHF
jgi:hypothetical protein